MVLDDNATLFGHKHALAPKLSRQTRATLGRQRTGVSVWGSADDVATVPTAAFEPSRERTVESRPRRTASSSVMV